MLRLAGPVRGNAIPVYSFTRLAEAVFRKEGGAVGRRLSDGGRRILMASAIEACQDRLEVYAAAAKSGRVTDVMLTAVTVSYTHLDVYKRQTLGSDAHCTQDLGKGIEEGMEMLQEAGFRYVALYEQRKPILLPLK